jgi:Asp/Glu/hydantoin racemase
MEQKGGTQRMRIKVIRPASRQGTDAAFMEHSARLTASYASRGTEVETVFLDLGHHGGSMGGHLNEARIMSVAPTLVKEVAKAEAEGWDAILLSGEYDVGAEIASHLVRIPVIDVGSVSVRFAPNLGDRAAMLVTQDSVRSYARKLLRRWGMSDFIGATVAWNVPLAEGWARRGEMRELTLRICREAMAQTDINVILPFCAVFVPFIVTPQQLEDELGIPVVNGVAVGLKTAEIFVELGMRHSRRDYPATDPSVWS